MHIIATVIAAVILTFLFFVSNTLLKRNVVVIEVVIAMTITLKIDISVTVKPLNILHYSTLTSLGR